MKIILGNLTHETVGKHSSFVPLGIAYIASYILDNIDGVEIRIYDEVDKMTKGIKEWSPHLVGLSNYCWNSNLSSLIFRYAKEIDSSIVTVGGGPEFPEYQEEIKKYMEDKKEIDFYIHGEGEIAFLNLVKEVVNNEDLTVLKRRKIDGVVNIDEDYGELIVGKKVERIINLDNIPSPYLNHLLDPWLDGSRIPSVETNRGCPFMCQYCHAGNVYYSKIGHFSVERIKKEIKYISSKMENFFDIPLSICDTNFGIYDKDEYIIDCIKETQLKYNWPILFDITTGKAKYKKILNMIEKIGGNIRFDNAIQSMNSLTLKAIKRNNFSVEEYYAMQKEAKNSKVISVSEFIMPLPEETKQSFLKGIKIIMDSGIKQIYPYTTMLLKGTGLASEENRKKYNINNKFRLIPKMFGEYMGVKCFEIEEVCVSTNSFSYDEYLDCRGFVLILCLMGSDHVDIIDKINNYFGISNFDFAYQFWNIIKNGDSNVSKIYYQYMEEVKNELWNSPQDIYNFFSVNKNYNKLLREDIGDNLIRKYRAKILINFYNESINLFYFVMRLIIKKDITDDINLFLENAKEWMIKIRNIDDILNDEINGTVEEIKLNYDINKWYYNENKNINNYKRNVKYHIYYINADKIKNNLVQRNKLLKGNYFYNISKLLNDGDMSCLWRYCKEII